MQVAATLWDMEGKRLKKKFFLKEITVKHKFCDSEAASRGRLLRQEPAGQKWAPHRPLAPPQARPPFC